MRKTQTTQEPTYDIKGRHEWKVRRRKHFKDKPRRHRESFWNSQYPDTNLSAIRAHLSYEMRGTESELYVKERYPSTGLYFWVKVDLELLARKKESFGKPKEYWQYLITQAKVSLGLEDPSEAMTLRWRIRYPREDSKNVGHEYFDEIVPALVRKFKKEQEGSPAQLQVQIEDGPFIPEDKDCLDWLLAASARLAKPMRYWVTRVEDAKIEMGEVGVKFESPTYETEDDGLPTFRLSDIPDDWEIELDDEFIAALDRVNRPGRYSDPPRRLPNLYWPANWKAKTGPRGNPAFKLYRRIWGWHRYKGGKDNGAWIRKHQIRDLKVEGLDFTDEDIERAVIGIRKGPHSGNSMKLRLPLKPNRWWAKMFGYYYSSGRIKPRIRHGRYSEVVFKLRGHEDVIPLMLETLYKIGTTPAISLYDSDKYAEKTKGRFDGVRKSKLLGTTSLRTINVNRPVYLVMVKFGLPTDFIDDHTRKGRTSSANINPRIPDWVSENEEYMHDFFEGYINGAKGQSLLGPTAGKAPWLALKVIIKVVGRPKESIEKFIATLIDWMGSNGLTWHTREEWPGKRASFIYTIGLSSRESHDWLLDNFEIRRPDLRARLLLRRDAWEDPVLYQALLALRTPDNVVLGVIWEQPRTKEEIKATLQLKEDRIAAVLIGLQRRGLIERRGAHYHYEPTAFVERFIQERKEQAETLANRMHRYATRLLNQCQQCNRTYVNPREECGLCGGEIMPVPRREVMMGLNKERLRALVLAHRVKEKEE